MHTIVVGKNATPYVVVTISKAGKEKIAYKIKQSKAAGSRYRIKPTNGIIRDKQEVKCPCAWQHKKHDACSDIMHNPRPNHAQREATKLHGNAHILNLNIIVQLSKQAYNEILSAHLDGQKHEAFRYVASLLLAVMTTSVLLHSCVWLYSHLPICSDKFKFEFVSLSGTVNSLSLVTVTLILTITSPEFSPPCPCDPNIC